MYGRSSICLMKINMFRDRSVYWFRFRSIVTKILRLNIFILLTEVSVLYIILHYLRIRGLTFTVDIFKSNASQEWNTPTVEE